MPQTVRLGDRCTGHSCYPPRPNIQASEDTFINKRGAHRLGDAWAVHCCGIACHGGNLAKGSPNVFVNGKPLGRIGDAVSCGSVAMTGSLNVFANDQ